MRVGNSVASQRWVSERERELNIPNWPVLVQGFFCLNGKWLCLSLQYTGHRFHSAMHATTLAAHLHRCLPRSFLAMLAGQPKAELRQGTTAVLQSSRCSGSLQAW